MGNVQVFGSIQEINPNNLIYLLTTHHPLSLPFSLYVTQHSYAHAHTNTKENNKVSLSFFLPDQCLESFESEAESSLFRRIYSRVPPDSGILIIKPIILGIKNNHDTDMLIAYFSLFGMMIVF